MFYLTVGFIALAAYCVALTVVVRRDIKDIHKDSYQCWNAIRRCWDDIDNNADDISDIRSEVMKANEVFSDLWDRIDAAVDKMLDIRVENILKERDALETKYRELLQKHNDLADAYDEYKKKHPDYIPVAKPDDRVTTCELKIEDDDFVDISDRKDRSA